MDYKTKILKALREAQDNAWDTIRHSNGKCSDEYWVALKTRYDTLREVERLICKINRDDLEKEILIEDLERDLKNGQ